MRPVYFKRTGLAYLPVHVFGWLATTFAAALCVWFFIAANQSSRSVTGSLPAAFIYASCVAFWWKWLAESTSEKQ